MKRKYKAKGNHLIVKKYIEDLDSTYDFLEEDIDKQKYLEGYITDVGKNVDKEEFTVGMLIRCAEFVAGELGEDYYHVNVNDIACEIELVEEC